MTILVATIAEHFLPDETTVAGSLGTGSLADSKI